LGLLKGRLVTEEDPIVLIRADDELADANARNFSSPKIVVESCDSPLEDQFLWEYNKVASPRVIVARQVEIRTPIGVFRPDFIIECPDQCRKIAVECDGREFHEGRRDARRDAAIVQTGFVTRVYRLRGKDICWHIYEVLDLFGLCEAWILSERGKVNLATRTLPAAAREDDLDAGSAYFTNSAWRWYPGIPRESEEDEQEGDTEDLYPRRPIVIEWTSAANPRGATAG
jgi:very-short-patch-repair endonuclease